MARPIGYTPPANAYSAMPIESNSFHGISPLPAQAAATQAMAPAQAEIAKSEAYDTQAAQTVKFQQLLQSGQQGMQAYIADVQKTNPELAAQFGQEFQGVAPYMQNLKGKELTDMALNMYDSWNGRLGGAKTAGYIKDNPGADVPEVIGQTNGSLPTKDIVNALGTNTKNENAVEIATLKAEKAAEAAKLKASNAVLLQGMRNDARIMAARIRATKDKTGATKYQYTYDGAQKSYEELSKRIPEMEAAVAKDPVMANFDGSARELENARKRQLSYQRLMMHATEHGADPKAYIDVPKGVSLAEFGSATTGTDAGTTDSTGAPPPAAAGPKTSFGNVSSKSPDADIAAYLKAINPAKEPTSQDIARYKQALATDEGAGAR